MEAPDAQNVGGVASPPTLLPGLGEVEACAVEYFLREMKAAFPVAPSPPPTYSPALLYGLAGALQLARLESVGITSHVAIGLTSVRESIVCVYQSCTLLNDQERDQTIRNFVDLVVEITSDSFSLSARDVFGVDMIAHQADEDVLIESLANFLWQNRPQGTN